MPEILVDTSALIAFFVQSEAHHRAAKRYVTQNPLTQWLIPDSVVDEFMAWLSVKVSIESAMQVGELLYAEHTVVQISSDDEAAIWETLSKYEDQPWTYTDCSILVLAQKLNTPDVFAFNQHLRQMAHLGLRCSG